jgi:uncharacterized protein (UPF0332 family)
VNLNECFKQGLLKKIAPDIENARKSLHESKRNVSDAEKNLKIGCYNVVVILSYTAMFHAARGLLFKDGVKERSHVCIPIYIKGRYPQLGKFADILDSYRIFRHRTVYGLEVLIDRAEAEEALGTAKEFIKGIEKLVG